MSIQKYVIMPRKPTYDKDELILRARDLFWKQGWAGTSMKDLEATLKLKPGSFYAAFGSKDALCALTLDSYAQTGANRLEQLLHDHGPLTALKEYPAMVIDPAAAPARACMLAKTLLELKPQNHPLAEIATEHLSRMEARFSELFAQAQQDGLIKDHHDPARLGRRYQSDLLGLRITAERDADAAQEIAAEIAESLTEL